MIVNISVELDEEMLEAALTPVHNRLARIESKLDDFVEYEVAEDITEAYEMGIVSDKVTTALDEVGELRTVTDGIVAWAGSQSAILTQLRADLATAIANGASEADLAGLDELIASTDAQTGRLATVLTEGTDAEGETPVNPVP